VQNLSCLLNNKLRF